LRPEALWRQLEVSLRQRLEGRALRQQQEAVIFCLQL
jgi:hypothetical protein